jgi:hypothetical protein
MTIAALVASLDRIGEVQRQLPAAASILVALVAAAGVLPVSWWVTRHLQVMAHEGAHATMNSALGVKVLGMEFKPTGEGATAHGPRGPLASLSSLFVGYLGNSLFGIGAAKLISAGYIVAVPWIVVAGLLTILVLQRKAFGALTVTVILLVLFLVTGFGTVGLQVFASYALAWFMLIAGLRRIREIGKESGDAAELRKLTKIPKGFWYRLWLTGTVAGLLFGAVLLI